MSRARRQSAFSLLEVMAAVAILGIWYVVLSGSALNGLRAEGESERRMRASLIADIVLADLEAQALQRTAPEVTSDEYEHDDIYTVVVEVTNLGEQTGASAIEPVESEGGATADDLFALIGEDMPAFFDYLREIRVEVSWEEAGRRLRVLRTTYAFDEEAAQAELGSGAGGTAQPRRDLGGGGGLGRSGTDGGSE